MPAQIKVVSVQELHESITENADLDYEQEITIWSELYAHYAREISIMLSIVQNNRNIGLDKEIVVNLTPFTKQGSQLIANFSVLDLSKPVQDSYNWHGQNTSQWLYAGALVYDQETNEINSHH